MTTTKTKRYMVELCYNGMAEFFDNRKQAIEYYNDNRLYAFIELHKFPSQEPVRFWEMTLVRKPRTRQPPLGG